MRAVDNFGAKCRRAGVGGRCRVGGELGFGRTRVAGWRRCRVRGQLRPGPGWGCPPVPSPQVRESHRPAERRGWPRVWPRPAGASPRSWAPDVPRPADGAAGRGRVWPHARAPATPARRAKPGTSGGARHRTAPGQTAPASKEPTPDRAPDRGPAGPSGTGPPTDPGNRSRTVPGPQDDRTGPPGRGQPAGGPEQPVLARHTAKSGQAGPAGGGGADAAPTVRSDDPTAARPPAHPDRWATAGIPRPRLPTEESRCCQGDTPPVGVTRPDTGSHERRLSARVRNCWPTGVRLPLIPKECRATLDRTGSTARLLPGQVDSVTPTPGDGGVPPECHGPPAPLPVGRTQTTDSRGVPQGLTSAPRRGVATGRRGRTRRARRAKPRDAVTALAPARVTRDPPATAARASSPVGNGLVYFLGRPRRTGLEDRVRQCEDSSRRGPRRRLVSTVRTSAGTPTGLSPRPARPEPPPGHGWSGGVAAANSGCGARRRRAIWPSRPSCGRRCCPTPAPPAPRTGPRTGCATRTPRWPTPQLATRRCCRS